jgi:hypothetical protein
VRGDDPKGRCEGTEYPSKLNLNLVAASIKSFEAMQLHISDEPNRLAEHQSRIGPTAR